MFAFNQLSVQPIIYAMFGLLDLDCRAVFAPGKIFKMIFTARAWHTRKFHRGLLDSSRHFFQH